MSISGATTVLKQDPVSLLSYVKASLMAALELSPDCSEKDGLALRLERSGVTTDSDVALTLADRSFIERILKPLVDHPDYRSKDAMSNSVADAVVALAKQLAQA